MIAQAVCKNRPHPRSLALKDIGVFQVSAWNLVDVLSLLRYQSVTQWYKIPIISPKLSLLTKDQAINASMIFYLVSLGATKISIFLLYRRVLPNRDFHAVIWGMGIFVLAFIIASSLSMIFACKPISVAWNPSITAKSINTEASILAVAVVTSKPFILASSTAFSSVEVAIADRQKVQLMLVFFRDIVRNLPSHGHENVLR